MAGQVALPARRPLLTSKPWIIAGLLLVVFGIAVKFLIRYAVPYFRFEQAYFDQFGYWPHRGRLILHICGAMVALICGPFQFWTGLRQIALSRLHRSTQPRNCLAGFGGSLDRDDRNIVRGDPARDGTTA